MTVTSITSGHSSMPPPITSGSTLIVKAGGTALSALITGGTERVSGVDLSGTITSGGFQSVSAGGVASDTVLTDLGKQSVTSGAVALSVLVSSGGYQAVSGGGDAAIVSVDSGGILFVLSGGSAAGVSADSGSYVIVAPGGSATLTSGAAISTGVVVISPDNTVTFNADGLTLSSGGEVLVLPGGVEVGGTILASATDSVFSGGQVISVTVDGGIQYVSGGTANAITLTNGGDQDVANGGDAIATVVSNGFSEISSGGTATQADLKSGGYQIVSSAGTANDTVVSDGGSQFVSIGGTANGTVVSDGGYQIISGGGTAIGTTVSSGGMVSATGTFFGSVGGTSTVLAVQSDLTIDGGGQAVVGFADSAADVTVDSGGILFVRSGGTAADVSVDSGGYVIVEPGGSATMAAGSAISTNVVVVGPHNQVSFDANGLALSSGTQVLVLTSGTESGGTILASASDTVFAGGQTSGVVVDSGTQTLSSGGIANSTVVLDDGVQYVFSGGVAISTVVSNGFALVSAGGIAEKTEILSGGVQSVYTSGFAISTVIESGGYQRVGGVAGVASRYALSSSMATDSIVSSGGFQVVSAGGTATSTTVSSGGITILRGSYVMTSIVNASATQLTVDGGGTAIISTYSELSNSIVNSGGILIAQQGSIVSGLTVQNGGLAILEPGVVSDGDITGATSTGVVVISADGIFTTHTTATGTVSDGQVYVLEGGLESGATLIDGTSATVFTGGTAANVTVDSSVQIIQSGGTAISTTVQDGGVQYVFSHGVASGTVVSSAYQFVDAAGMASGTVLSSGGIQAVDGTVSGTDVGSGGALYVVDVGTGFIGTAIDPTIEAGGAAYINGTVSSGTVSGFAILSGTAAVATDMTIAAGGEIIASGGAVSGLVVSSGGVFVADGSTVTDPTIEAGGTFIELPGTELSSSGAIAAGSLVSSGHVVISGGTSAFLVTQSSGYALMSGATGFVFGGAVESDTTIGLNAVDRIADGGVAYDDIIGTGGDLFVASDGKVSGGITFSGLDATLTLYTSLSSNVVVSGFAATDTIDFEDIVVGGTGAISAFLVSGHLLEVTSGAASETVNIGSGYANDVFSATASNDGGVAVTISHASSGTVTGTSDTPVNIPIYVIPYQGSYKLGIEVSLDDGQSYRMVELDTGASGFFAAYSPDWWSSYTPVGTAPDTMSYVSGNDYAAQVVNTSVTLQTTSGTPLTVSNVNVGLVTTAANDSTFTSQAWNTALTTDSTNGPLDDSFYGDFGLGLNDNNGIEAVLAQLGDGLSNGFAITIGNYPDGAPGQVGDLQVGLTTADIESYTTIIALNAQNVADVFANSGYPTYGKAQATGTITVDGVSIPTSLVFDTGATHTTIFQGTTLSASADAGSSVTLSSPSARDGEAGWSLSIPSTGNTAGVDQVGSKEASGSTNPGAVNTGIGAYYGESIMFDVADGIIGIKAISCFAEGTRIRTPKGERAVETLAAGDRVMVLGGGHETVQWLGHRTVDCLRHPEPARVLPVRVAADAFGPGLPARDLVLSPDHALYLEDMLIPVKYLINGDSVAQINQPQVTYYHLELPAHDVIFAEGLPAETYLETGQRAAFANGGTVTALHPQFAPAEADAQLLWAALGYAPLVISGPAVERLRVGLAKRPAPKVPRRRRG